MDFPPGETSLNVECPKYVIDKSLFNGIFFSYSRVIYYLINHIVIANSTFSPFNWNKCENLGSLGVISLIKQMTSTLQGR